jgi:Rrf2 family protein
MLDLAQHPAGNPIPLAEIAKRQDLSEKYLEQLIILLRGAGLIRSVRGSRGGYMLARKPEDIGVGEMIEVLEGRLAMADCVVDPDLCDRSTECLTTKIWVEMTDLLEGYLLSTTLQDILVGSVPAKKPHTK